MLDISTSHTRNLAPLLKDVNFSMAHIAGTTMLKEEMVLKLNLFIIYPSPHLGHFGGQASTKSK